MLVPKTVKRRRTPLMHDRPFLPALLLLVAAAVPPAAAAGEPASPLARITGVVQNADDATPVQGAAVQLWSGATVKVAETTSAADGRFELTTDRTKSLRLLVRSKALSPLARDFAYTYVKPVAGQTVSVPAIRMVPAAGVSGVVRDADTGKAIAGARVYALDGMVDVQSDAEGRYELAGLPVGVPLLVRATVEGYDLRRFNLTPVRGEPVAHDFPLRTECVLSGRVLTPDGVAAEGVSVHIYVCDPLGVTRERDEFWSATTDADGRYSLRSLSRLTRYEIGFFKRGFLARSRSMFIPDQTAYTLEDYRLREGREASGSVVDANGLPVAGAEVIFVGEMVVTDADGRFHLKGLTGTRGETLYAMKKGYAFDTVDVPPATGENGRAAQHGLKVTLGPAHSISGTVVDEHGAALPDVEVRLSGAEHFGVLTDALGRFTFDNLPDRKWRLLLRATGFVSQTTPEIAVDTKDARIVLKQQQVR